MQFTEEMFARHMRPITGSAIREVFKLLGKPGMISFAGGNPSNTALEPDVIARLSGEVLEKYGTTLLQYGATDGFMPFRESAAAFLNTEGVLGGAESLLPVQGGSQAFDLLLKALIDPGDVVLCESPTFLGAIQAMREYNAKLVAMLTDEGGVIVEAAEELIKKHHPKLMYVIPTFQNPTGITLACERRKALAALASKYGVVIAEDDPYRDLRYSGEALPPIQSFDEEGWVVYMSSFSKYISPGMRLGAAMVRNPMLLRKMVIGKQSADVHSPLLTQAIVDAYLRQGLMPGHIERICGGYAKQLNAMLEGFRHFPEGTVHTVPQGGLFVWAELPQGMDALEAFPKAVDANVAYVAGTYFYPDGGHERTMRLNFSMCEVPVIEEGMQRLGAVLREAAK
ncbi:MAG: PLP-dependent aminotransferase family protein [Clostridiales bacterium]|nr:PLP-dependent aminotransferase family protein [Clostridiales bacterium]